MATTRAQDEATVDIVLIELERLEIGFDWHCWIDDLPIREQQVDAIIAHIRGYVWSEKLGEHSISYPKDWWEAVKARFAPKWLLLRYPVKLTRVALSAKALYPNFQRPAGLGKPILRVYFS